MTYYLDGMAYLMWTRLSLGDSRVHFFFRINFQVFRRGVDLYCTRYRTSILAPDGLTPPSGVFFLPKAYCPIADDLNYAKE